MEKPRKTELFCSRPVSRILQEFCAIWLSHAGSASLAVPPDAVYCRPRDAPVMHGPERHARPSLRECHHRFR
jgi:hypothetical protein